MKESPSRWMLYGSAAALIGVSAIAWANTDTEADVMVLLSSAEVQLQAAYMTPAEDLDGAELSARRALICSVVEHLESVERRRPGMAVTAEFRGFAHMLQGEHLEAASCYARARGCDDCGDEQRDVLTFNEARMLAAGGRREQALAVFDARKAALDDRYGARRRLEEAKILVDLGRPDEAVQRLRIVTADAAATPMARLDAGLIYCDLGLLQDARDAWESASSEEPIADYYLARLKLGQGDVDSSLALLERAYEARPAEVRQRLLNDADAWSAVNHDDRYQLFVGSQPASPGR